MSSTSTGHLLGYARVSSSTQDVALQHDALLTAGCSRVFVDVASGARSERPQLTALLDYAREGDVLVVWRLDRLGRSLRDLVNTVHDLTARGIGLRSLNEAIDTTTANGRLILGLFAVLAEFERELIRDRTNAGLAAARERGRSGGRPPSMTPAKLHLARTMRAQDPPASYEVIAQALGLGKTTVRRHLAAPDSAGIAAGSPPATKARA